nr:serine--tRNA ligase [Nitrospira sp.]
MYDLRVLRDSLDDLRDQLGPRGKDVAWEDLRKLTEDRRTQTVQVEELRH